MQSSLPLRGAGPLAEAPVRLDAPCASDAANDTRAPEREQDVAALRARLTRIEQGDVRLRWGVAPFADASINACLPLGGLQRGHWHEIGGDSFEAEFSASVTGFAAALAQRIAPSGMIVWALRRDDLHVPGLQAFGVDADRLILVRVDNDADVLAVQEEGARTRGVAAVIGEVETIDLVAGRRLQLACEKNGATGFVVQRKLFGARKKEKPLQTPAAATRWRIAPVHSVTDEPGLGNPRWHVWLERCRGGRTGAWVMEMQNAPGTQGDVRVVAELADHTLATDGEREFTGARHYKLDRQFMAASGN